MNLHHFYHVYAAGNWAQPVTEHCKALTEYGLYDELDTFMVGFVGTDEQVAAVRSTLDVLVPKYGVCGIAVDGWEQVTLNPLYEFVQSHDGPISYAHTKGSSRNDPIDRPWRRMMTYHNFVDWRTPVAAVQSGDVIAGCYWIAGATPTGGGVRWTRGDKPGMSAIPSGGIGPGGIFGGNFWWTTCELLRDNVAPDNDSRHAAEHWLGQLLPLTGATTYCMRDWPIGDDPPPW